MAIEDAQKSEVHATTGDASTSPAAKGDRRTTKDVTGNGTAPKGNQRVEPTAPKDLRVVRDDTDAGGPLVIESSDPKLQPPLGLPSDPFPTERKPEIDPPQPKQQSTRREA